jgi:hypothetical protein
MLLLRPLRQRLLPFEVRIPVILRAASATFALKAALCVRLTRLAMLDPDTRHYRRSQADFHLSDCPN